MHFTEEEQGLVCSWSGLTPPIHLFIYVFRECSLSTYYVPGAVVRAKDADYHTDKLL